MKQFLISISILFTLGFQSYSQSLDPCLLLYENGHYTEALECNMNAIEKGGDLNKAYFNIATIYFNNEQYDIALGAASKAIEANSSLSNGYSIKGYSLVRLGRYEQGNLNLATALLINPNDGGALFGIVECMEALYDFEKIETQLHYCDRAIDLFPKSSYLHRRRGFLKLMSGQKVSGCIDVKSAIDLGDTSINLITLFNDFCKD